MMAGLGKKLLERLFIRRRQFRTYADKKCTKDAWIHSRRRWLWQRRESIGSEVVR